MNDFIQISLQVASGLVFIYGWLAISWKANGWPIVENHPHSVNTKESI